MARTCPIWLARLTILGGMTACVGLLWPQWQRTLAAVRQVQVEQGVTELREGRKFDEAQLAAWIALAERGSTSGRLEHGKDLPYLYYVWYRLAPGPVPERLQQARASSARILAQRPLDPMAWLQEAMIALYSGDRSRTVEALLRSQRLGPMDQRIFFIRLKLLADHAPYLTADQRSNIGDSIQRVWRDYNGLMRQRLRAGQIRTWDLAQFLASTDDPMLQEMDDYVSRHRAAVRRQRHNAASRDTSQPPGLLRR